jgi:hypothetical protein
LVKLIGAAGLTEKDSVHLHTTLVTHPKDMQNTHATTITLKVYSLFPHALHTLTLSPDPPAPAWCRDHLEITLLGPDYWVRLSRAGHLSQLRSFFPALMNGTLQGRFRGDFLKTGPKQLAPVFAGAPGFSHQAPTLTPQATSVYRRRSQGANFTIRVTIKKPTHERNHHHSLVLS